MSATVRQVTKLPGSKEAVAIIREANYVHQGLRAFLRLGLRLLDVRQRVPHGHFIDWVETNVTPDVQLGQRQIYNALSVAEYALEVCGLEICSALQICTSDADSALWELVDGKSQRRLLGEIHDYRQDAAEEKAKAACKKIWEKDADLRDNYLPKVLGGQMDYCDAIRAMSGRKATKGKKRSDPDYQLLLPGAFKTMTNGFSRWDALPDDARAQCTVEMRNLVRNLPAEVKAALAEEL